MGVVRREMTARASFASPRRSVAGAESGASETRFQSTRFFLFVSPRTRETDGAETEPEPKTRAFVSE